MRDPWTGSLRTRLRALPVFIGASPVLEPAAAPEGPTELFLGWLDDAIAAGLPAPHAMTLSTADHTGRVSARTLILRDVDGAGWHFATAATSPKGRDLAGNPNAALTFFWPGLGRQVRLTGSVSDLGTECGAQDFRERGEGSRAATLVGHQSEPLSSREVYWAAFATSLALVRADADLVPRYWSRYALAPDNVEFWQASTDKGQTRLLYRAEDGHWEKGLLWP